MSESGGGTGSVEPALTTAPDAPDIDVALVVNGTINVRKTHPNLYLNITVFGLLSIALGINFWVLSPTFLIFDFPNWFWGTIFLTLGTVKLFFLNFYRCLKLVRGAMAFAVGYLLFLGLGTMQPFLEGTGSLQLPILYLGCALLQSAVLLEPFINPWTARR
jgi:hypothetical protein